ncbi:cytochrome c-551 precursor [mine drainage metagenome]|uniref:Cytochrome c-551 n=1 Tax=mine drainage metagenome TaxID=410659 RepID=A0A1J5SHC7_9ZZZZ
MKSIIVSLITAGGLMVAGSAMAIDMPPLAKKDGCTACHAIDHKVVGPAWMDVAKKYKGATKYKYSNNGSSAPDAKEYPLVEGLMMKVSKGGHGNWGTAAMIPNDPAGKKQAEIKELVEFELSLAK